MPPALSDDAASDDLEPRPDASLLVDEDDDDEIASEGQAEPMRKMTKAQPKAQATPDDEGEDGDDNGDGDEDEDEDDEDLGEDEFIVEAIKKHMVDEDGSLKFLVKWEGWNKKSDMTWEPEDNLMDSASEILIEYYRQIGGRDSIFEESQVASRSKKRGRASTGTATSTKRPRKNGLHPADSTPPASTKKWSPPAGSWEDEIESIDACEDEGSGRLAVYLIWKNGRKTKHDTSVIYKKCPQKMLQFYEMHVKIIRDENQAAAA
ncbi:hypothetical protein XA68_18437 [Ophiocordyceps unilateralis]|uniref:Chromo domain-containing protein n=1 Tax=Ophiocordyceps unilateralis TaxID=268505 RepID=A0A2A9P220_OPHUN|nr:hypothetical protein XA68_18437 [Ophiocordyceps unilateralis]